MWKTKIDKSTIAASHPTRPWQKKEKKRPTPGRIRNKTKSQLEKKKKKRSVNNSVFLHGTRVFKAWVTHCNILKLKFHIIKFCVAFFIELEF